MSRQNQEDSYHLTIFNPEVEGAELGLSSTRELNIIFFVAKVHVLLVGD